MLNPKYLAKKQNETGSHLSKTASTLDSEGIRGFMLEPACTATALRYLTHRAEDSCYVILHKLRRQTRTPG